MDIMINGQRATSRGLCRSIEKATAYLVHVRKVRQDDISAFPHPTMPGLYVIAWLGGTK